MIIPEGYRELLDNEVIKEDDLTFIDNKWVKEGSLFNNWTGKEYIMFYCCYRKIRKIDKNESKILIEKIHAILETLRQNRAFNADSAFYPIKIDDYEICLQLKNKKIIKSIKYDGNEYEKEYFYLDKKDINQLLLLEILEEKT